MRLSKRSRAIFEEFFSGTTLCRARDFPDVSIYTGFGAKLLTGLLLVDGITFKSAIYVSPRWVRRSSDGRLIVSKHLLAHEIVHVFQYQSQGSVGFLKGYLSAFWKEFRKNGRWTGKAWFSAYKAIPHEVEARRYASEFKCWINERKLLS